MPYLHTSNSMMMHIPAWSRILKSPVRNSGLRAFWGKASPKNHLRTYTTTNSSSPEIPIPIPEPSEPHIPVLLPQVTKHLSPQPNDWILDATFGNGGYSRHLLDNYDINILAMDRDPLAIETANELATKPEYKGRLIPIHAQFSELLPKVEQALKKRPPFLNGIVMDIGVSSMQFDTASRGFSFRLDGPLDMRMSSSGNLATTTNDLTAEAIINYFPEQELVAIFSQYGEERFSKRIARAIIRARGVEPIRSTGRLRDVVLEGVPGSVIKRWRKSLGSMNASIHPATRVFQALRIYINDELGELRRALHASQYALSPNGRLVVVSFHSLEDRIVKQFFRGTSGQSMGDWRKETGRVKLWEQMESGVFQEDGKEEPSFVIATKKVVKPDEEEMQRNPRSRSAKLRAAVRTKAPPMVMDGFAGVDEEWSDEEEEDGH